MKEVEVNVDLAGDGSGYSLSIDHSVRTAFVWKEPSETYSAMSYHLLLPLTGSESEVFNSRNIKTVDGVTGYVLRNVNDTYFTEV